MISWVRPPQLLKKIYYDSIWSCWLNQNILFSFDDGPSLNSSKLLDFALEMNVKFAFFVLPDRALKYPHIVKRMVDEGHVVGTHFMVHENHFFYSKKQIINSLHESIDKIQNITQHTIKYCRAPYGLLAPWQNLWISKSGYVHVFWSLDGKDYKNEGKEKIIHRIKQNINIGDVILLHEWEIESSMNVDIVKECLIYSNKKFKNI